MSYALITGASQGIGEAFARQLAQRGHNLLLIARSEEKLRFIQDELRVQHNIEVHILAADLSDKEADQKVLDWILTNNYNVNILINNAGYGLWGDFDELTLEEQLNMMQLNMVFPVSITHKLIPMLATNSEAYILNVSSTAAYQAVPTLTVYSATKSFILSFSRGLAYEMRNTSVSVTCLCPGGVKTGFVERSRMFHMQKTAEKMSMEPQEVAKAGLDAMFSKKKELVPGLINKLGAFMTSIVPKAIVEKTAGNLYEKK